jgi:hypothetical protein
VFECSAELHIHHPLLRNHPGVDLYDFSEEPISDPVAFLSDWLCGEAWGILKRAGAHRPPPNIALPAVAILRLELVEAIFTGERIAQQFFGREVSFVPVPHWSVGLFWSMHYAIEDSSGSSTHKIETGLSGQATNGDYIPLELDSLLAQAIDRAFGDLPGTLADEGGLGNLFFARIDRPAGAPDELGSPAEMSPAFWLLLSPDVETRHAAMAITLSSERLGGDARSQLARWFLLNDPDIVLRQDALAWLLGAHSEEGRLIDSSEAELVRWVLQHDRSARMRSNTVEIIAQLGGEPVRALLLLASLDKDMRVADLANSKLRRMRPAALKEMDEALKDEDRPLVAPWTTALDGRVVGSPIGAEQELVRLAEFSEARTGTRWLSLWLAQRPSPGPESDWVIDLWTRLAAHPSEELRAACLARFAKEIHRIRIEAIVVERIYNEPLASLRARAIGLLDRGSTPGALGALLEASRSPTADVRRAVAKALSMMSDAESAKRLEALKADDERKVRREARKSLRKRKRAARTKR